MNQPSDLVRETRGPRRRRLQQIAIAAVIGCALGVGGSFAFYFGFFVRDHGQYHRVRATSRAPCPHREIRSTVLEDEWRQRAQALSRGAAKVRLVPTVRAGQAVGFKIFAIEDGTLPSLIGLKSGDTLTAIQGLPVTDTALALEVLRRLTDGSAEVITIDGERRGCPVKFIVTIEA